jgi:large subunit ribosomal protein L6
MSRLAKKAIVIPDQVHIEQKEDVLTIKGIKGVLHHKLHPNVKVKIDQHSLQVIRNDEEQLSKAIQGTTHVIIGNHIKGVTEGFTKKLQLHGVGYKAKVSGHMLELNLGKSHPIEYKIPHDIKIETPSQTDIIILGSDRQLVGQVAADIRMFRKPEPYKGKGVRYADEVINLKETKTSKK